MIVSKFAVAAHASYGSSLQRRVLMAGLPSAVTKLSLECLFALAMLRSISRFPIGSVSTLLFSIRTHRLSIDGPPTIGMQ